jgi:uncharacterized protein (TIGR00730 family)
MSRTNLNKALCFIFPVQILFMAIQSVAVFCGSHYGNDPLYKQHTEQLGKLLAENNITIIYGGGGVGLMGTVADTALNAGGKVVGVIPKVLVEGEREHNGLTELHVVPDMHPRKKMMYDLCDAAIVLPGGYGTLDEMFEVITWNTLNIHNKRIIVLNTAGYYNLLLGHINQMQIKGFLQSQNTWEQITIHNTPDKIIEDLISNKN